MKRESLVPILKSRKTAGVVTALFGLALVAHGLSSSDRAPCHDAFSRSPSDIQHEIILGVLLIVAGGSYFKFGWPIRR